MLILDLVSRATDDGLLQVPRVAESAEREDHGGDEEEQEDMARAVVTRAVSHSQVGAEASAGVQPAFGAMRGHPYVPPISVT